MQINSDLLRSVVFICEGPQVGASTPVPVGTAFVVALEPTPGIARRWKYLVTAAHVLDDIVSSDKTDGYIWIRFNGKDGQLRTESTRASDWIHHRDRGADIAALRWPLQDDIGDHVAWSMAVQLSDDLIQEFQFGPGDDVYLIGLFAPVEGKKRNIPIVRAGNIAAMPAEPIFLPKRRAAASVFLIEAKSMGGLSGSPVFAHFGHNRMMVDEKGLANRRTFKGLPTFWMGIMHGHYEQGQDKTNMGIAVVTPHEQVVSVINSESEIEARKALEADARNL